MASLAQTVRMAVSKTKQTDLHTAVSDMISLRMTSKDIPQFTPINETDKDDLGKGVYATRLYPSHCDVKFPVNGFLSSQWAKILVCYGFGNTTGTTPDIGGADGLDLPPTTFVVANGQGTANSVVDQALIGVVCDSFGFKFTSGTGRQNATFTSQWEGSGVVALPSGIAIPAPFDEELLNAGGMVTCTINGVEYLASKRFVSYEFDWKNNTKTTSAYFPGSGTFQGFQVKGRMRRGSPAITTKIVVEVEPGSPEQDNLLNQTPGTAVITVNGAAGHSITIAHDKVVPMAVKLADNDGIVTYDVDLEAMQVPTAGSLTAGSVVTITVGTDIAVSV